MRGITNWCARAALTVVVAAAWAVGCAGDVGLVDLVQPNYIKKSDLVGSHWYYRRTVVDAPETMGPYASIGTGDLFTIERIRWDIQEDWLIAYRDYEWTPGSQECELEGNDCVGTPVASFPITKHFDIITEYNPETGEETNVRREDTLDRVWNEREYMRVDFSRNGNPNIDFILPVDFLDTNNVPGGNFYIHPDDAKNPWHARLTPDEGYMDFVVNHYVMPDVSTCYYEYDFNIWDAFNCGAGEIRVRHAFMRVDPEEEASYDPLYYPDGVTLEDGSGHDIPDPATGGVLREPVFEKFGFYRLDKLTYDDERGLTESGRLYNIIRFHIWEKSRDANGDTIPYEERTPKPIVYTLNWDFPEDLIDAAVNVASEWNIVFQKAVASLQSLPTDNFICDEDGDGSPDAGDVDCDLPQMFILQRNSCNLNGLNNFLATHGDVNEKVVAEMGGGAPTVERLDNWCSATEYHSDGGFAWEQIGDPRYNMMYWITNITPSGFAGYGPMFGDPISGRNVTATAFVMGWTVESAATRALEYIDYMNGEITLDDLLLGSQAPNVWDSITDPQAMTHAMESVFERANVSVSQEHLEKLSQRMQSFGPTPEARLTKLENSAHFAERMARVQGTTLERDYLTRPEDLMLAARGEWMPGQPVPEALYENASFVNRIQEINARRERTLRLLQERTMCPMADLDNALVGLAARLKDLGKCAPQSSPDYNENCVPKTDEERRDMRRQWLRETIFKAVMLHEVGHNVGLRHNFEGSYDALNYFPEFWEYEAEWGPTGSRAVLDAKLAASQPEYMYSSIMDYHGKTNGDFRGLGLYDTAAIKFGYGQLVERFDDPAIGGKAMRDWTWEHDYRELMHDSDVDGHSDDHAPYFSTILAPDQTERYAILQKMHQRHDVEWDWNSVEGRLASTVQTELASEVPYMFCSDEYAGRTPTCKRFDFGANQREVAASNYVKYKNYFLFTNFLRYRLVLDWDRVLDRSYTAFTDTNMTYQYMYLYSAKDDNFQAGTDLGADMATAVGQGLNLMSEVLAMPKAARFYRCMPDGAQPDTDVTYYAGGYIKFDPLGIENGLVNPNPYAHNGDDPFTARGPEYGVGPEGELCSMLDDYDVSLGTGFPLFFGFSEDYVAWTFTYLGTYWDKQFALYELTDPLAVFFRENQEEDIRTYSISLLRLYPDEVNDIMLNLIEYDRKGMASRLDPATGEVVPKAMISEVAQASGDGLPRVQPALARNLQLYSLLYGMAFLTSPLDETLDFAKHTRVALKGSPEDFSAFEEATSVIVECTLPESGRTYRGIRTASEGSRIDIGYNFVTQCSDQLGLERGAWTDYEAKQQALEAWELANGGPNAAEQAWVDLYQAADDAWVEWEFRDFELRQTEQAMMFMRELNTMYEYGVGY